MFVERIVTSFNILLPIYSYLIFETDLTVGTPCDEASRSKKDDCVSMLVK